MGGLAPHLISIISNINIMNPSDTINNLLSRNKLFVPANQRAYSWKTPSDIDSSKTHTDVFLSDLEAYNKSLAKTPYSFGHFLLEKKSDRTYAVIDGQQRLTTIVIFLSALFSLLTPLRLLTEDEEVLYESMIKRKSRYAFSTVDYDNQLFKDYVIDQTKRNKNGLETDSAKRIVKAFDFFLMQLADLDEYYLVKMLNTVSNASCTTNLAANEYNTI